MGGILLTSDPKVLNIKGLRKTALLSLKPVIRTISRPDERADKRGPPPSHPSSDDLNFISEYL
jgi:hypothetical protein